MINDQDESKRDRRMIILMKYVGCRATRVTIHPHSADPDKPDFQASGEDPRRIYLEKLRQKRMNGPDKIIMKEPGMLPWIYAQFNNDALAAALEKCAKSIGRYVFWGDGFDLIECPRLIGVIDRTVIGLEWWQSYLDFLEDAFDGKPDIRDSDGMLWVPPKERPLMPD